MYMANVNDDVLDSIIEVRTKKQENLRSPERPDTSTLVGQQKEAYQKLLDFSEGVCDGEYQRMFCFEGYAGVGKAQPLTSDILTPNGWIKMGDVFVGQSVISDNGKPCEVLNTYPQGELDVFKVTFSDGTEVESCGDHLWKVADETIRCRYSAKLRKVEGRSPNLQDQKDYEWVVLPLNKFKDNLIGRDGRMEYCVPYTQPVDFNESELLIDPYVLGVLLGDGSITTNTTGLTSEDEFIISEVNNRLGESFRVTKHPSNKYAYGISSTNKTEGGASVKGTAFHHKLRDVGVWGEKSENKIIPNSYMFSSVQQRLDLLRGLMDTDGTVDKRGQLCFGSTSEILCSQVFEVVKTLGGCPNSINTKKTTHRDYYRFTFKLPHFEPFLLPRKLERLKEVKNKHNFIKSVEYVGKREAQCIEVSDKSKTYITNGVNVTHNTYCINMFIEHMIHTHGSNICACAPTHKAKVVLMQMAQFKSEEHLHYATVHSILGLKRVITEYGEEKFMKDKNASCAISDYNLVIIDESSMLDDILFGYLIEELEKHPIKIIFVGDHKQLPPVNHSSSKPMCPKTREAQNIGYSLLTQIVRQKDGNPIIKLSKDIREGNFVPRNDLNTDKHGVLVVPRHKHGELLKKMFTSGKYEEDPNYCRVVAWTNECVNKLNARIRKMIYRGKIADQYQLLKDSNIPTTEINETLTKEFPYYLNGKLHLPKYVVGDKIIADKPIIHPESPTSILFQTNEEMIITDIKIDHCIGLGEVYKCYIAMVKNLYTGKEEEIEMVHENSERDFEKHLQKLKDRAIAVKESNRRGRRDAWRLYYELENRFARLKYAPCLTTYKSQGSTYENIIIMVPDIEQNPRMIQRLQHLYVGVTRATKRVFLLK